MKRHLLALLLAAMLSLSACALDAPPAETTAPPTTTAAPETVAEARDLTLIEAGTPLCVVMRPEHGTQAEIDAAMTLHTALSDLADRAPKITTDWIKPGAVYDETAVEVLIGRTGQPASAAVYADLGYGEYRITVAGAKLVVAAWTAEGMSLAVNALRNLLRDATEAGTLTLDGGLDVRKVVDGDLNALPLYPDGEVDFIQPVGNTLDASAMQVTLVKTTREAYLAYREALEADGYALVQENAIGENRFVTPSKGETMVTAYHMGLLETTRLIVEPAREIVQPATPYTAVCDTTLWQLGLSETNPDLDSSMNAYIVRLGDGRFVLIDTGTTESAKYQLEYMRSLTPAGETPVVAAVIITHPHVDHMDGFLEFAARHRDALNIEAVYLNYGAFAMQSRYVRSTFERHWRSAESAADAFGAAFYVMRTGQRIELADAVFEVLWTPEDYGDVIIEDYNNACVVTRMTVGDSVTLFLGDCRDKASPIVVQMYASALKCDLITVAHHGYGGSVSALYDAAQAEIVFWPNLYYDDRAVNRKLLEMACVKAHYLAADGDVTVTLVDR